jgi:uncharacterized protein YgiM (DUF1202 family)
MRKGAMIAVAGAAVLLASLAWAAAQSLNVQVREGQLRRDPSFLSPVVGTLGYGAKVNNEQEQGSWIKVSSGDGQKGWMHLSALTDKQVAIKPGAGPAGSSASREEMALAGKGFNKDVEADFKAKNKETDFAAVDRMESAFNFKAEEMAAFLQKGGVQPGEGGAR